MAYVEPEEVEDGEKTSATKYNVLVNDVKSLYSAENGLGCRLYLGNHGLTADTYSLIAFSMTMNAEIYNYYDDAGFYSAGSPQRLTIPVTGRYLISFDQDLSDTSGGFGPGQKYREISLRFYNSAGVNYERWVVLRDWVISSNANHSYFHKSEIIGLTAGDYMQVFGLAGTSASAQGGIFSIQGLKS